MATIKPDRREYRFSGGRTATTFPLPPQGLRLASASDQELAHYGLPSRPDRETQRDLHAIWTATFSRPAAFIAAEFEETDVRHLSRISPSVDNTSLSSNWTGVVVSAAQDGGDFINRGVMGTWNVPRPYQVRGANPRQLSGDYDKPQPPGMQYCSTWVGIDGDGSVFPGLAYALLQAGVETAVHTPINTPAAPYAWWQWSDPVNDATGEVKISSMPVRIGGYVEVTIWVTSPTTAVLVFSSDAGPDGWTTTSVQLTAPGNVEVIGGCAEWIVEAPLVDGAPSILANYQTVGFTQAMALAHSAATVNAGQGDTVDMVENNGQIISTAQIIPPPERSTWLTCTYGAVESA